MSSYDFFAVDRVRKELAFRVTGAVAQCGGSFWNGAYTGLNLSRLFDILRVELEEIDVFAAAKHDSSGVKIAAWQFQPALIMDASRKVFRLQVPRQRLQAHREYKLTGYLLRALADRAFMPLVSDYATRKELAWEFCDQIRWRYKNDWEHPRSNQEISAQLAHLASPAELHRADIPLSQVTAYMARLRPDIFSFAVYYIANVQEHLTSEATECAMHVHRELGYSIPRLNVMVECHCDGVHDLMSNTPVHTQVTTPDGCHHIVVTDTAFKTADYFDSSTWSISLLEINRTVLFTMNQPLSPPSWY